MPENYAVFISTIRYYAANLSEGGEAGMLAAGGKTTGMEVCLKTRKPVQSIYNLRIPTGDCMLFPVSGARPQLFRAKTRPENPVGIPGAEVGALSRRISFI